MQNQSPSDITVNLGEDEKEGIQILVTSENGQSYLGSWKRKEGMSLIGKVQISAASSAERVLTLEDWNISPPPGIYHVHISFKYKISLNTGDDLSLPPVEAKMEVVNTDGYRIRQECEVAKSQYLSAVDSTEASVAVNLLTKFKDPSALDCLTTAYESDTPYDFGYLLIHAIGRIGTSPSRLVLLAIANGSRKEDAGIAKSVLQNMKVHSSQFRDDSMNLSPGAHSCACA